MSELRSLHQQLAYSFTDWKKYGYITRDYEEEVLEFILKHKKQDFNSFTYTIRNEFHIYKKIAYITIKYLDTEVYDGVISLSSIQVASANWASAMDHVFKNYKELKLLDKKFMLTRMINIHEKGEENGTM